MSKSEESGGGFIAGFLLGGLVGAGLALLITPRSGEETRGELGGTGIELRIKAEDAAARVREEADELLTRGKAVLDEQKARVQDAMDAGKEAAAQKRSELLAKYRVAKEQGEMPLADIELPEQKPEITPE